MSPRWIADPLLRVDHLTMRFGGLVAVNDVSFSVGRGDITALIGPNGAGKTTLFNCLTGFYKPTAGRIAFSRDGLDQGQIDALTVSARRYARQTGRLRGRLDFQKGGGELFLLERMADHEIARKAHVARTFQNIRLFPGMSALENLMIAQNVALSPASGWSILGLLGAPSWRRAEGAAVEKARKWLERIGLIHRANDPAGALPYGDQRRLEIARAMCSGPALLCLDEPAAGLNGRESAELGALLRSIRDEDQTSFLLIEHDIDVTNPEEVVWAFASRAHPSHGEIYFQNEAQNILPVFLDNNEKFSFKTTKVMHNCLLADRFTPEKRPKRSDFQNSWTPEIQEKVLTNWHVYGFR